MKRLQVLPIVEGHGEERAVRILLERLGRELIGGSIVEVLHPIPHPRTRLIQEQHLQRSVELAAVKLRQRTEENVPQLILLLLDAEEDPACTLAPQLLDWMRKFRGDFDSACVLAVHEYETWFAAAAESLSSYLDLKGAAAPVDPERAKARKAWVKKHFDGVAYSETIDQPAMTASMDLQLCRERSPSFDKLCRELEKRLRP
jgi:hypothetical protein